MRLCRCPVRLRACLTMELNILGLNPANGGTEPQLSNVQARQAIAFTSAVDSGRSARKQNETTLTQKNAGTFKKICRSCRPLALPA